MEFRRSCWVHARRLYELYGVEEGVERIARAGFTDVLPITVTVGGPLYPSRVRPPHPDARGRDLVGPFVREARRRGLRVHAWIVSLCYPHEEFEAQHKDLYVVNRLGASCVDEPPYVPSYKWLCPTRKEVRENLAELFLEIAERYELDGLHFDYIRLPDVLLPRGLRSRYPGVPGEDVMRPEFDYCYCGACREGFRREGGVDPVEIPYGSGLYEEWVGWRAERITSLVRYVAGRVRRSYPSLELSAAVFATPSLALRYVFQDWPSWGLDLYHPMIYHRYYGEPVEWIGEAVEEGVSRGVRVSAGIFLGFMESYEELRRGVELALEAGAVGVTAFVYPPPRPELEEWVARAFGELGGQL